MDANLIVNLKEIPVGLRLMSDEEDEEVDADSFGTSDLLQINEQDEVSNSLLNTGTISGVAAAAALVTSRKREQRPHKFESNPSQRKRQHTRLIRKLKQTIHELCMRCGQQAVVVCVSPGKRNPVYRVFGSSPLDRVIKNCQDVIFGGLEKELQGKIATSGNSNGLFDLPQLTVDGIPTSVDEMNQAHLRMFIPEMLKYSLGRGKPGWGKESKKPVWWPHDVPWANVRRDDRSQEAKLCVSWTEALRQIVKDCYRFHGRDDLLSSLPLGQADQEPTNQPRNKFPPQNQAVVTPPTLVQTIHNPDGSVSLVQVDSGQTIATISRDQAGSAVATFADQTEESQVDAVMEEMANTGWTLANQDSAIDDAYAGITNVTNDSSDSKQQTGMSIEFGSSEQVIDSSDLPDSVGLPTQITTSAMVQIPVAVYEKIARTIQQTGGNPTLSISPDGRLQLHTEAPDMNAEQQKKVAGKEMYHGNNAVNICAEDQADRGNS